jgi:hypothetical protein
MESVTWSRLGQVGDDVESSPVGVVFMSYWFVDASIGRHLVR